MTRHSWFAPRLTRTVIAALITGQSVFGQEFPPAPPEAVLLVQAPAEPTPVAPILPDLGSPVVPAVPTPLDLPPADPGLAVPDADVEAFARGPVHEAFADVYELNPSPSEVVPKAPPAAVDELPPEQVPQGDNVQWISGYWAWDVEGQDFLWVSGVWRDVPPGRRWVPGYWAEVAGGYQWVSGFWADAQMKELAYVPPPPESLEVGPNVPAPSEDHVWVPGSWTYVNTNYSWSPGYYTVCQPNYMWVPNQYVWTPRGCVYVPGYMDYRFANRGLCFSPVRFRRPLYAYGFARPAWYRPRYTVSMSGFLIHLFVRPRCRNYWYGDYYGAQYANFGFTPWYRRTTVFRRAYDPAFNFYRWDSHRHGQNFVNNIDTWHRRYESNVDLRPPHLVRDHDAFLARHQGDRAAQLALTTQRLDEVVKSPRGDLKYRILETRDLNVVREAHRVNRELEVARQHAERDGQVGKIVDLKAGVKDERGDRLSIREGRVEPNRPDRLKLNDLPTALKDKTQESVARAERLREQAQIRDREDVRSRIESPRESRIGQDVDGTPSKGIGDRNERGQVTGKDERPGTSNIDALRQRLEDRKMSRDTSGQPANDINTPRTGRLPEARPALPGDPGTTGQSPLDALRQRAEERRNNREATVGSDSQVPRTLERGPTSDSNVKRGDDLSAAQQRAQEIRQQAEARRQEREVQRQIPEGVNGVPRSIDRSPVERALRIDNSPRQIERNPVERAPIERAPRQVEQVPRNIERAPIERAPVERAPRQIEQAPRHIERAPVERAPRQIEHAPRQIERAPRERAPSGGGGRGSRKD